MSTAKKSTSPKSRRTNVAAADIYVVFMMADEFRPEQHTGKVQAIGLYPDRVLIAGMPPGAPEPTKEVPIGLDKLGMLFTVGGGVGELPVEIKIGDSVLGKSVIKLEAQKSANIIVQANPFLIASFGKKQVTVNISKKSYVFDFEIRRQQILENNSAQGAPVIG